MKLALKIAAGTLLAIVAGFGIRLYLESRADEPAQTLAVAPALTAPSLQPGAAPADPVMSDEQRAKRAAWDRYYRLSPDCLRPPTFQQEVACGNRYVEAKSEFEERWARGELRQ